MGEFMAKPVKLTNEQIAESSRKLGTEWRVVDGHHLEREYSFRNFKQALEFTNQLGAIAEEQVHHPDIFLAWGKVKVTIHTHSAGGLTELDFALATKFNELTNRDRAA
jgi:4a-hydroxytetrahydrobiopterin dehydratase